MQIQAEIENQEYEQQQNALRSKSLIFFSKKRRRKKPKNCFEEPPHIQFPLMGSLEQDPSYVKKIEEKELKDEKKRQREAREREASLERERKEKTKREKLEQENSMFTSGNQHRTKNSESDRGVESKSFGESSTDEHEWKMATPTEPSNSEPSSPEKSAPVDTSLGFCKPAAKPAVSLVGGTQYELPKTTRSNSILDPDINLRAMLEERKRKKKKERRKKRRREKKKRKERNKRSVQFDDLDSEPTEDDSNEESTEDSLDSDEVLNLPGVSAQYTFNLAYFGTTNPANNLMNSTINEESPTQNSPQLNKEKMAENLKSRLKRIRERSKSIVAFDANTSQQLNDVLDNEEEMKIKMSFIRTARKARNSIMNNILQTSSRTKSEREEDVDQEIKNKENLEIFNERAIDVRKEQSEVTHATQEEKKEKEERRQKNLIRRKSLGFLENAFTMSTAPIEPRKEVTEAPKISQPKPKYQRSKSLALGLETDLRKAGFQRLKPELQLNRQQEIPIPKLKIQPPTPVEKSSFELTPGVEEEIRSSNNRTKHDQRDRIQSPVESNSKISKNIEFSKARYVTFV